MISSPRTTLSPQRPVPYLPLVDVIAHRGYSGGAPENTLAAFALAIQKGARSIELDVQWTRDDVPVIAHDPTLGRTNNGKGRIADLDWADLEPLDAGSWFSPEFAGEKIPTLEMVLQSIDRLPGQLYLDLKPHCHWSDDRIQHVLQLIDRYQWRSRSVICSFDFDIADRFNSSLIEPIAIGYSLMSANGLQELIPRAITAGACLVCAYDILLANPDLIWEIHSAGLEIVAWTVDREADMQQLSDYGIDRIITNKLLPGCVEPVDLHNS